MNTPHLLMLAAEKVRVVHVTPAFKFSWDVYFNPPESGPVRNFSNFIINPVHVCSASGESNQDSPFLVMLVLSSYLTKAAKEREAIRATYGSVARGQQWPRSKPLAAPVRMVFLLGRPPTAEDRQLLEIESIQNDDLVVADFVDSYQNLTLKVLHGLYWTLHNCPQTKFVMKADDDVFINLPLLTTFLLQRGSDNSVYGHIYFNPKVERQGRWAVPQDVYPLEQYPDYMSGTAYVMSKDAAQKILGASNRLPLVPVEDAFITGILVQVAKIRRMRCTGFTYFMERKPELCTFVTDTRFVGNGLYAAEKMSLWATLKVVEYSLCL